MNQCQKKQEESGFSEDIHTRKGLQNKKIAFFHLPGLFEFYELYKIFLPLWRQHRDWFYPWCEISSIYGAPADSLWGGGRTSFGQASASSVINLMNEYGISARLTFSNSLLKNEHLTDKKCNELCRLFEKSGKNGDSGQYESSGQNGKKQQTKPVKNGVILHSDLLSSYLKEKYPGLYQVSSTTKVLTSFNDFKAELDRPDFLYVVPDFRLNKCFDRLESLSQEEKDKVEFLCNECCDFSCKNRKACYENVSRKNLEQEVPDHKCRAPGGERGYSFSLAKKNPAFIGLKEIQEKYLPLGFSNFKIEGRGLGSAIVLEFLLYYLTKPDFQLEVREAVYLDSMLDLF